MNQAEDTATDSDYKFKARNLEVSFTDVLETFANGRQGGELDFLFSNLVRIWFYLYEAYIVHGNFFDY